MERRKNRFQKERTKARTRKKRNTREFYLFEREYDRAPGEHQRWMRYVKDHRVMETDYHSTPKTVFDSQ